MLQDASIMPAKQIEEGSPSAGRHGALVLAHGSETSGPPHGDCRCQRLYKGAELEGCA
jgi:hypothetical protein